MSEKTEGEATNASEATSSPNTTITDLFKKLSIELDEKHDRYERIVKLSRDITIESKRIIFLLHNKDMDSEPRRTQILEEAERRLNALVNKHFRQIAIELNELDAYQYLRAYTAGLQEFIEAVLFYEYLKGEKISEWGVIDEKFLYKVEGDMKEYRLLFPQNEYMLGMADFTGELMRKCVNSLTTGMFDYCFKTCAFVRYILTGFFGTNLVGCRELNRKLFTLKQSLGKMELVCYNIRVRGNEIPKHMLALVGTDDPVIEDEGYFN